jgi:hypothetical protein
MAIGLRVNEEKTKFFMVAKSERTKNFVDTNLVTGSKRFEVVSDFVYLGSIINNNHETSMEIKWRILAAYFVHISQSVIY